MGHRQPAEQPNNHCLDGASSNPGFGELATCVCISGIRQERTTLARTSGTWPVDARRHLKQWSAIVTTNHEGRSPKASEAQQGTCAILRLLPDYNMLSLDRSLDRTKSGAVKFVPRVHTVEALTCVTVG